MDNAAIRPGLVYEGGVLRLEDVHCQLAAQELGIPASEHVVCFELDGGDMKSEWAGFHFEFIGIRTEDAPNRGREIYAEKDGVRIRVRRLRVRNLQFQTYLEALALPGYMGFASINLMDLDIGDRTGNVDVLRKGLAMIYPYVARSRPTGSGLYRSAEEFHSAYRDALATLQRQNLKPRLDLILEALYIGSKSTFYRYKRMFGLPD